MPREGVGDGGACWQHIEECHHHHATLPLRNQMQEFTLSVQFSREMYVVYPYKARSRRIIEGGRLGEYPGQHRPFGSTS
eukprot:746186-Rhodomonas_salina.1